MNAHEEFGKELKVSDLKPKTVVWLSKEGSRTIATMWVIAIDPVYVHFYTPVGKVAFLAKRTGENLDEITDDEGKSMMIYEYLGTT